MSQYRDLYMYMYVCHADDIMTHVLGMWTTLIQAGQQVHAPSWKFEVA